MESRSQFLIDAIMTDYTQMWAKLAMLRDEVGRAEGSGGREISLAVTKLEEFALWFGEAQRKVNQSS